MIQSILITYNGGKLNIEISKFNQIITVWKIRKSTVIHVLLITRAGTRTWNKQLSPGSIRII